MLTTVNCGNRDCDYCTASNRQVAARQFAPDGYSDEEIMAAAKYVNEMLDIMAKHGSAPKLTLERYGEVVRDVLLVVPPKGRRLL